MKVPASSLASGSNSFVKRSRIFVPGGRWLKFHLDFPPRCSFFVIPFGGSWVMVTMLGYTATVSHIIISIDCLKRDIRRTDFLLWRLADFGRDGILWALEALVLVVVDSGASKSRNFGCVVGPIINTNLRSKTLRWLRLPMSSFGGLIVNVPQPIFCSSLT